MSVEPAGLLLSGRTALITGAAAGIGRAIAQTFANAGASLALCDRDAAALALATDELRASGCDVESGVLDVRDGPAVRSFVDRCAARFGAIHVLVANAGGTFEADLLDVSEGGERALVDENFTSVTHCVRAVVPHMPADHASIVHVSSVEASRAAPGYAVYAAMKAGVESLTRSLALELADRGIRVNCLAPDAIATPGVGGGAPPTPLGRAGAPDDVAGPALFLASDLSRFVTGAVLAVDGGTGAAGGWRRGDGGRWELG